MRHEFCNLGAWHYRQRERVRGTSAVRSPGSSRHRTATRYPAAMHPPKREAIHDPTPNRDVAPSSIRVTKAIPGFTIPIQQWQYRTYQVAIRQIASDNIVAFAAVR